MTMTLPHVVHEHHERLLSHVDQMPETGELLLKGASADVKARIDEIASFLTQTLLPHVDAAERSLYPELERMMQNRHSMTPMRREHDDVRRLVRAFAKLAETDERALTIGTRLSARRVLFQLYAVLKIHLAEEEVYLHIVEKGVSNEVAEVLAAGLDHPVSAFETAHVKD